MSIREAFLKANIQAIIALIVVSGGMLFLAFVNATDVIKTSVSNMMLMVLGFYFGSSRNSQRKDELIAKYENNG
jgi:hypothetical protein